MPNLSNAVGAVKQQTTRCTTVKFDESKAEVYCMSETRVYCL